MKYMLLIYDCNICEENHILKTTWSCDCEMDMKHWAVDMASEVVASLLGEAKRAFANLHPNGVFKEDRLMFSQVFEGEENEEGTDKAKI